MRKGFTLVELLVVIAILTILMALFLPMLSHCDGQAASLQCLNNLRQMAIAATGYAVLNDGHYPIAYYTVVKSTAVTSYNWDFTTTTSLPSGQATVTPGLLWQGNTIEQVQQCPVFDGKSNTTADPYTGYNYNASYIGGGQSGTIVVQPLRTAQIRQPSRCALFGDGQYASGANKFMRAPFPGPDDVAFGFNSPSSGTQGFRHLNSTTNVVFCDGHGETLSIIYTAKNPLDHATVAAGTGFISIDNSFYESNPP
jgi:prepilin-type N-terminal cleavage/methylation domain-containing protein/prepilin-type processing-associated H-X9-DG protein